MSKAVNLDEKYGLVIYIWNNEEDGTKDYQIRLPMTIYDEGFCEFKEYVLNELKDMIF